jgi:O-antigen biosynthesis protein
MSVKVSAIVSTYNSADFLPSRLQNLLDQTHAETIEIIVVNSGSLQNESEIVRSFQEKHKNIRYLETEHENLYQSWNRAVAMATGEYITNANTDDRLCGSAIETLSRTLDLNQHVAVVYADCYRTVKINDILNFDGTLRGDDWTLEVRPDYSHMGLLLDCLCGPQPMWRRSLHEQFGQFDPALTVAGDYDFWLRAAEHSLFLHVPQALGLAFDNPGGIENRNRRLLFEENKLLRLKYFGGTSIKQRETTAK